MNVKSQLQRRMCTNAGTSDVFFSIYEVGQFIASSMQLNNYFRYKSAMRRITRDSRSAKNSLKCAKAEDIFNVSIYKVKKMLAERSVRILW